MKSCTWFPPWEGCGDLNVSEWIYISLKRLLCFPHCQPLHNLYTNYKWQKWTSLTYFTIKQLETHIYMHLFMFLSELQIVSLTQETVVYICFLKKRPSENSEIFGFAVYTVVGLFCWRSCWKKILQSFRDAFILFAGERVERFEL